MSHQVHHQSPQRQLLIMRHAHALPQEGQMDDWSRPLSDQGRKQAEAAASHLQSPSLLPSYAFISDAQRTRHTWECLQGIWTKAIPHSFHREIYQASSAEQLMDFLEGELIARFHQQDLQAPLNTLLVLGHNPILEELVLALIRHPNVPMAPASVALLSAPLGPWCPLKKVPGQWQLQGVFRA